MTADALDRIFRATRVVLLDFDGPVTPLLPSGPNAVLASAAREPLYRLHLPVPDEIAGTSDHLAVLRFAADRFGSAVVRAVETMCAIGEVEAARHSEPTPGAKEALQAMAEVNRPVVIVTNNTEGAVRTYLKRLDLEQLVKAIAGRPLGQPELMKPHPDLVRRAIVGIGAEPHQCVMIGDSVTDIEVSLTTGVRPIGFAKTPERGRELADAGAEAVVSDMAAIRDAVVRHGPAPAVALLERELPSPMTTTWER